MRGGDGILVPQSWGCRAQAASPQAGLESPVRTGLLSTRSIWAGVHTGSLFSQLIINGVCVCWDRGTAWNYKWANFLSQLYIKKQEVRYASFFPGRFHTVRSIIGFFSPPSHTHTCSFCISPCLKFQQRYCGGKYLLKQNVMPGRERIIQI